MSLNRKDLIEDCAELSADIDADHAITKGLQALAGDPEEDGLAVQLSAVLFVAWSLDEKKWDQLVDAWKDVLRATVKEAETKKGGD